MTNPGVLVLRLKDRWRLVALAWLAILPGVAAAQEKAQGPALVVEPSAEPAGARVVVNTTVQGGLCLLEIVDARTGATARTLHAGTFTRGDAFFVARDDPSLRAGPYRVRLRQAVELAYAGALHRPGPQGSAWINPTEVVRVGDAIYVYDAGQDVPADKPELAAERAAKLPSIFKLDREGKPDASFGEGGRLAFADSRYALIRTFAVDPDSGVIYIASLAHHVAVFDRAGKPEERVIGGWDEQPAGPKCTPGPHSLALGWLNRIYITAGPYASGKVYDRTKSGFEGVMYAFAIPGVDNLDRYVCTDGAGALYACGREDRVTKLTDDGKAVTAGFVSPLEWRLAKPTGGAAAAGLVWLPCHGPGYGPYWDSGGGGEIALLFDAGQELRLVARFGVPGQGADRVEFLNPAAAAVNPQGTELWIAEDGLPNPDGPPGNARVRRFEIRAKHTDEAAFELPARP